MKGSDLKVGDVFLDEGGEPARILTLEPDEIPDLIAATVLYQTGEVGTIIDPDRDYK